MRMGPPVFAGSSPTMSSTRAATVASKAALFSCFQSLAIMNSAPQMKVKVRLGAGSASESTIAVSARAISSWVPTPLALSQAPGSSTWASSGMRSPAVGPWPGSSAIRVRSGSSSLYLVVLPMAMPRRRTGASAAPMSCSR